MQIHVHKRNEKFLITLTLPDNSSVEDLKNIFCEKRKFRAVRQKETPNISLPVRFYPERQRFTVKDREQKNIYQAVQVYIVNNMLNNRTFRQYKTSQSTSHSERSCFKRWTTQG